MPCSDSRAIPSSPFKLEIKNPPANAEDVRLGFDPWVGKIPWRRECLPTPVFWRGEFHGLFSPWGRKELDMTLGLALGSPIFPSGCEGKLGVALESLQGLRDLT